jgi:hypothetical protein
VQWGPSARHYAAEARHRGSNSAKASPWFGPSKAPLKASFARYLQRSPTALRKLRIFEIFEEE